jgi:hypothetical protein
MQVKVKVKEQFDDEHMRGKRTLELKFNLDDEAQGKHYETERDTPRPKMVQLVPLA